MTTSTTYLFRAFVSIHDGIARPDTGLDATHPGQVSYSMNMGARFITDGELGETYTNHRANALPFTAATVA